MNENFLRVLINSGYKRTDAKLGKLKGEVSHEREVKFIEAQKEITKLYKKYREEYSLFILGNYEKQDNLNSRNCFHLGALNRYQRCLNNFEYMVKSLHNEDLELSDDLLMILNMFP